MVTETTERDEARRAAEGGRMDRLLERLMDRTGGRLGVQTVFGEPLVHGDVTVVPVARVRWVFGGGGGSGPSPDAVAEGPTSGIGAGGAAGVHPVGFLEITSSGAVFKPIVDPYPSPTLVLAAGITIAFVLRALGRLLPR